MRQAAKGLLPDEASGKRTLAVRLGKQGAFFVLILWLAIIYLTIIILVASGLLSWFSLLSLLTLPIFLKLIRIIRSTEDWVLLDQYGKYVRMLYFFNGIAIILGVI
ncbi:MAG: 1,4-dihydroxy-2-naphthoate polyprenyltransferase [Deltaproteobacteria bacterium]|nr:1,4-dihydroxy-2-naphthoate polyprenyltransferase [Deltaproteobacteria bacterium]